MHFPASDLQRDLSLDRAIVIGLNQQACTGMLGSLRLARALLADEPEWNRVLCVTADRFPEGAVYEQAYNLVSDAAAACLVSRERHGFRLVAAHHITNGGLSEATNDEEVGTYFSYTSLLVTETLRRAGLHPADIDWIVPQNTNQKAWQIMSRLIGVDVSRVWQSSIGDIGHAISADNVINLAALAQSGQLKPGQRVLLLMAGHGLNWQSVLLEATEVVA
jgi:3-oxoacyl-[acyl-carrier-protein] synthase-3